MTAKGEEGQRAEREHDPGCRYGAWRTDDSRERLAPLCTCTFWQRAAEWAKAVGT